jgi:bifunctional non-homologous end joining protein LigD
MTTDATWQVDGRTLEQTKLDRVLWPDDGITKGDLLDWYRAIAPVMLPHLRDRPVTLRSYPGGIDGTSHYRREIPDGAPEWIRRFPYETATNRHTIELPFIEDAAALLWFVNTGAIEIHAWPARAPELDEPDQVIFDLDPGDETDFSKVLEAARILHAALDELSLTGYAKTSGGKGLHVFLPLAPGAEFKTVRTWVKILADKLAADHPDLIATGGGATHEGRLVTIDYAQNSIGRNTAAPYPVRARPGAPVSTPVTWEEIDAGDVRPEQWTIRTVPERVGEVGDLFRGALSRDQHLPPTE